MKPGKTGPARLADATAYSLRGLRACWRDEAAFRQEVALVVVLLPLAFFIARSALQWLLLVAPALLLLIVELLNSAIENAVDRMGDEINEFAGRAKDMGSAAVFLNLVLLAVCWAAVSWANFA